MSITKTIAAAGSEIISAGSPSQISVNFPSGGTPGVGIVSQYQWIQPNGIIDGHQGGLVQTFDPALNTNQGESKPSTCGSSYFVNSNAQPVEVTIHSEISLQRGA